VFGQLVDRDVAPMQDRPHLVMTVQQQPRPYTVRPSGADEVS
jgi:hypothetical protein